MRRLVLVGCLAWAGGCISCTTGPTPDLALDMGSSCQSIALEVRDDPVLPGWDVHALAVVRSGGEQAWALATNGKNQLRLKAWPDGPDHDLSGFGEPEDFRLIPGPVEGQTWLTLEQPTQAGVWRFDEFDEEIVGGMVEGIPGDELARHRLVFLGDFPYLAVIPRTGDASTMQMSLVQLDPDTLAPGTVFTLPLWTACFEDGYCNNALLTGPVEIDPIAVTEAGLFGGAWMMIGIYGSRATEPPATYTLYMTRLLLVQLRSTGIDRPPQMLKVENFYPPSTSPVVLDPAFLASDTSGFYWLAGLSTIEPSANTGSDLLFRLGSVGRYVTYEPIASAKRELRSHLLQIGGRAALGQIPGNTWTIAPLGADGVDTQLIAKLVIEPDAEISSAGRSEFLVRGGGRARRVAAVCADDPKENDEEPEDE
ncbi:MAG TPA: hypothetical protein VGB85_04195 [Nannocystis sp.]